MASAASQSTIPSSSWVRESHYPVGSCVLFQTELLPQAPSDELGSLSTTPFEPLSGTDTGHASRWPLLN